MPPKLFYSLLFVLGFFIIESKAQEKLSLLFVDEKTDQPISEVRVYPHEKPTGADGRLIIKGSIGDSITVVNPDYPIHTVLLTGESPQVIRLNGDITPNSVFIIVDEPAEFPGGMEKFYQQVNKTMRYPAYARRHGIEGKVFVRFIIGRDGQIEKRSVEAIKTPDESLSEEAIRVVRESKAWTPAKKRGQNVRQAMVLPLTFRLG